MPSPLTGRRILVTRERPGRLAELLEARGAEAVHVPLIGTEDPLDGGTALRSELGSLDRYDWLVVTSPAGAERVAVAAASGDVRLAAVGTATADVLAAGAGRPVDLVPARQLGVELAKALVTAAGDEHWRVLIAHGDLADGAPARVLRDAGHQVTEVVAYRTVARRPAPEEIAGADALALASGSAAASWVAAFGVAAPPIVVAIGPSTAAAASEFGLKVSSVAADHSLEGLVTELEHQFSRHLS